MIYGYIRVSSDKQTVENQRYEIHRFCHTHSLHIDGWIEETISGTAAYTRRALGRLLGRVVPGDTIICSELSRLGRNLFMIMEILNLCMTKECRVWTIKDNYRLGDDIQSKVLAFAFGLSAEIERNLISQRTREALARRPTEGTSHRARETQALPQAPPHCRPLGRGRTQATNRAHLPLRPQHLGALRGRGPCHGRLTVGCFLFRRNVPILTHKRQTLGRVCRSWGRGCCWAIVVCRRGRLWLCAVGK